VKCLGVKGGKDSKDGGVKDSYVSTDSMLTSFLYHLIRHLSLTLSIPSLCDQNANVANKETEVKSLGVKGGKDSKDGGVVENYVSANSMLTSFLYHLVRHLSLTLSIPSLFDQVDGNVAKETEVKSLGVKGVKDSKDGGVKDSYVSANSMLTSFLYHLIRHLSLTLSIPSLFDQVDGNVAKETEVKSLGVKGVKDSKDGGVVESYVSTNKYADIISLSSIQASLIDFINPFSL